MHYMFVIFVDEQAALARSPAEVAAGVACTDPAERRLLERRLASCA